MEEAATPPPYYYPPPPKWHQTFTGKILLLNVLVFIGQIMWDGNDNAFTTKWAMSLEGMRAGHWWQLLTYQFLHGGFIHILFNCLLISVMGKILEAYFGKWRFLGLYILSGVVGGLIELYVLKRHGTDSLVLGASAGAAGLVASFATLFPFERLKVLLLFVIPVAMSARTLLWLSIVISVVGMTGIIPGNIAHAAHLGGLVFGILATKFLMRRQGTP